MDAAPPKVIKEIEGRVGRAVTRYGIAGTVRIVGDEILLESASSRVATEISDLLASWLDLDGDERQRRISALARTLVVARGVRRTEPPKSRKRQLLMLLAATLLLAAAVVGYQKWHESSAAATLPSEAEAAAAAERQRVQKACEVASERASRGETLGPNDTLGFVVELVLLREDDSTLVFDPGLLAFVDRAPGRFRGRFVWAGAPEIRKHEGPGSHVELIKTNEPKALPRGVTLIFNGNYVRPYFSPTEREAFLRTARTMAERLDATYAAVYARCAHLPERHAAAWLLGPSSSGAAASLVYFMGTDGSAGGPMPPSPGSFPRIRKATSGVDLGALQRMVSVHGGTATARDDGSVVVSFPFEDPTRARRAALEATRDLGIAWAP